MVYLIHFDQKYQHAQHYLGFVESEEKLQARMECHKKGLGSRLMRAVSRAGIGWSVVRTWPDGDRNYERLLKNKKKSRCLCPICQSQLKHK